MPYALGGHQVNLLQIAYNEALNFTATVGKWSRL